MPEISRVIVGQPAAYLTDPHAWVDSRANLSIRFALYESLVKYDPHMKIVPGLATGWQVEPDARTWTFSIRTGVRFHDGSLLTARDAAASLRRAVSPEMPGEYGTAALLASYLETAEITATDDHTLRVITAEPMADLLDLLLYAVIVPEHCLQSASHSTPGTGPYRLVEEKPGEITLRRFDAYWAGPAPVVNLVFRALRTPAERVAAFLRGEVDILTYMPLDYRPAVAESAEARVIERTTPLCVIIMFNAQSGPCADPRVRQALNHAADMDEIIARVVHGNAVRLNGPLSPFHSGADPDLVPYAHDVARARRLLAEAGYPEGLTVTLDRPSRLPDEIS